MFHFTPPCLENTLSLDIHGIEVTGQARARIGDRDGFVFECRFKKRKDVCAGCGAQGKVRGTTRRVVTHMPLGVRPTRLLLRLRQFLCPGCGAYWREQPGALVPHAGSKMTDAATLWALAAVVLDSMSIRSVARNLGTAWATVNNAVFEAGYEHLISDPHRFDGVHTIGVDEHAWRHVGRPNERMVTVIMDLSPRQEGRPARLLDIVEGRSKEVFKTWLAQRDESFQRGVKVVAMDGFLGYKNAVREALGTGVTTVMDPFHVVQLAGQKLNQCRQRIQQEVFGRRGRKGDLLFRARRALLTSQTYLSERTWKIVQDVITTDKYAPLFKMWAIYQGIISAYHDENPNHGRNQLAGIIDSLNTENTRTLPELRTLARTLKRRRNDILAYFTHPNSSNGPTESLNGRLEHLRGIALGFRNLTNYITRSLLHTGGFRQKVQSLL